MADKLKFFTVHAVVEMLVRATTEEGAEAVTKRELNRGSYPTIMRIVAVRPTGKEETCRKRSA